LLNTALQILFSLVVKPIQCHHNFHLLQVKAKNLHIHTNPHITKFGAYDVAEKHA